MPGFRFSEVDPFNVNWEAFLTEMDGVDPELSGILRANTKKLAAIVRQSNRNAQARSDFNAAIVAALKDLSTPPSKEQKN